VYFAAIGGLGALLAKRISAARIVAYEELGPEALFELELTAFPAVVIIDRVGNNLHDTVRTQWRTEPER
jgi:fumarate hydratase subunit beta